MKAKAALPLLAGLVVAGALVARARNGGRGRGRGGKKRKKKRGAILGREERGGLRAGGRNAAMLAALYAGQDPDKAAQDYDRYLKYGKKAEKLFRTGKLGLG